MKPFKHIYIEEEAYQYSNTQLILEKYPNSIKIKIQNYKQIFNRTNQNFQAQKKNPKLILAVKKDNFLYKGSGFANSFGNQNFYYNTMIMNCIYNCDYCYLQGMYNSSNILIFVNEEDFFNETSNILKNSNVFLCISYDTDILTFEEIIPYTSKWINFAKDNSNLLLEVRTKSNLYSTISNIAPSKNVVLAWTVSPDEVIKKFEKKTPVFNQRIKNIQKAISDGWNVRICIDPIVRIDNWKEIYLNMIPKIFSYIDATKIYDLNIGVFRINSEYLKSIQNKHINSEIIYDIFENKNGISTYPTSVKNEILKTMYDEISKYINPEKIIVN